MKHSPSPAFMKKLLFFYSLGIFLSLHTYAQIENTPLGGRALGLANASVTLQDPWALWNNVAGIANLEEKHVFIAYDNRFGIGPFQTFGFGAVLPSKYGSLGLSISRFGDNLYNEPKIGLGYAYEIDRVSLGLKVNYVQSNTEGLNSAGAIIIEFGGIVELTDQLTFAAHGYNLNQAELQAEFEEDERLPTILKAGIAYKPIEELFLSIETEKDIDFPATFKAGVEYRIIENLFLRTGIQAEPFNNHFGIGFSPKKFIFDYALTTRDELGISHHISIGFRW